MINLYSISEHSFFARGILSDNKFSCHFSSFSIHFEVLVLC